MIIQLLITAIISTSAMTLFSYLISESFKKLYKEPLLLKLILDRFDITISEFLKTIYAWVIHYLIGFIFVIGYHLLWFNKIVPLTILSGLYLGAVCGIIGIISWIIMFRLSGFYKKSFDKGYYVQLFFAHIIFGLTAFLVYTNIISIEI
ncbi:hypothetical protein [Flavobacterium hungaricum]|uniref:Uncharacterized protein n=1 Tax=Flavobacterium hungaricum TaxID=2082725 RepID=A0ABR9TM50_9FLAO|nr:hypothetical protein [Flavobacterium hungaricum]MBE8726434.1 hypothetical protein [Flavobacterium hungaricum]